MSMPVWMRKRSAGKQPKTEKDYYGSYMRIIFFHALYLRAEARINETCARNVVPGSVRIFRGKKRGTANDAIVIAFLSDFSAPELSEP